jgi:hypothetical protein
MSCSGQSPDVNPITGHKETFSDLDELKAMTDEEKEIEAEKLFVAFDRLNKLGVIKCIDPATGKEIGK